MTVHFDKCLFYINIDYQPFQRETNTMNTNEMPPTGGLMGLVMPLYTIGIVVFFLYTILRVILNSITIIYIVQILVMPCITTNAVI